MDLPFIGSEALAAGLVTRHALRTLTRYTPIHPGVYLRVGVETTAYTRAVAAWLWTGRAGVLAGRSAALLHGAKWVDDDLPAQVLHTNRRRPEDLEVWSDRYEPDEVQSIRGMLVTTPARTALDLACRLPLEDAVAAIDALARATKLDVAEAIALADRYSGRRAIRRARHVLDLVDAGAESPQETRLRLLYIRAGFPRPQTQIKVYDEFGWMTAVIDMGWPDILVGADYEGDHHRLSRRQFNHDIRRHTIVTELGWDDMRITVEDTDAVVVERARRAFERRGRIVDVWAGRRFPWDVPSNVRRGRKAG